MAPGIFFNSIKSGIAVDYPVFKDSPSTPNTAASTVLNPSTTFAIGTPSYRLPFEALVDVSNFLPKKSKIYYTDPQFLGSTQRNSTNSDPPPNVYFEWSGSLKPQFEMATNNFLAETVKFFLKDNSLKSFKSAEQKKFKTMASGNTYYMDIVLRKTNDFILSEGGQWPYAGSAYVNDNVARARGHIYGPPYVGFTPE